MSRNAQSKDNFSARMRVALVIAAHICVWPSHSETITDFAKPHARVVVVHHSQATSAFEPQPVYVRRIVERGLAMVTGRTNALEAWRGLVTPNDVLGIKVYCAAGPLSGTRPAVVGALVETLLAAGHPATNIVLWDKNLSDLRAAKFTDFAARYGVRVEGAADAGFDEKVFYEIPLLGRLIYGDKEFGSEGEAVGRKSFVSKLVTRDITRIINVTPVLNHYRAGVAGTLYSLAIGSVDNTMRFEADAGRLAQAVPEIYALAELSDRVVLNVADALICQYQGEHLSLLHYSEALNEVRFSNDPVALDILSLQELERRRRTGGGGFHTNRFEIYSNASLLELGISQISNIRVERVSLSEGN